MFVGRGGGGRARSNSERRTNKNKHPLGELSQRDDSRHGALEVISQEDLLDLRNQVAMAEIPTDAVETDASGQSAMV